MTHPGSPPVEFAFRCPLPNGLHARPASRLVDLVMRFGSQVLIRNGRTGEAANARSLVALIALDARFDDPCVAQISGTDAAAASAGLRSFVESELPGCDGPLSQPLARAGAPPRALRGELSHFHPGTPVAAGIGEGRIVHARGSLAQATLPPATQGDGRATIELAFANVRCDLESRLAASPGAVEADILGAHLAIARDETLKAEVGELVERGRAAGAAIVETCARHAATLRRAESAWIRERALDIEDIGMRLLESIGGAAARIDLSGPSVVVAETLTPGQLLALERPRVAALVLGHAGTTSHTVILARSFGIPTLTGVSGARALASGTEAIVDAHAGVLILSPSRSVRDYYRRRRRAPAAPSARLPIGIHANVSSAEEVEAAIAAGADGIGLFRTEMLLGIAAPSEEQQFLVYARAAEAARGRPVVIRTFDVGGDKPVPYLNLPREPNPFLGVRGIRFYPRCPELIRAQVRAIQRASAFGTVRMMLPMVSTLEEVRQFKSEFDITVPLGAMIEVPSAAFLIPELSAEVDFFSIGSNDLLQYFMAADRDNAAVAHLYTPRCPPFIQLLRKIVEDAHRHHRKVSLCGEMARDPGCLPLLIELGIDEVSVAIPEIATLSRRPTSGPLDPALLLLDSESESREEVIDELTHALRAAGRTQDPRAVEEAIWAREEVATTALGNGFAIPHCKCDAIMAPSIGVVRLRAPVRWGDERVTCAILLALRDADVLHMKLLSRLARRLMHEEFREGLLRAANAQQMLALLSTAVEEG